MIDLRRHDSLVKKFLSDRAVLKTVSGLLKHGNSEVLLRHVISRGWSKSEPTQYKDISKTTDLEISAMADTLKSDLNESLAFISSKYDINPPAQLYFRTKKHNIENSDAVGNSNIGAHFACSVNKNNHISGTFADEDELIMMLSEALMQIKDIGRQEALQILDDDQSTERSVTLKYLRSMKEVLRWDDKDSKAKWFRKTGPIAVDFAEEKVCPRPMTLKQLSEHVFGNEISILEGDAGSGKSVLVRQLAYDRITKGNNSKIYYYSFKLNLPINDFREFLDEINAVNGIVIIEDIHLSTPNMQHVMDSIIKKTNRIIIFTTRPSFRSNMLSQYGDKLKKLPVFQLNDRDDSKDIVEYFSARESGREYLRLPEIGVAIRNISESNLWLLSYALEGCNGEGEPSDWVKEGVIKDLKDIRKLRFKPQILVALSPLSMKELFTSQLFLIKILGFQEEDLEELVERNEIIEYEDKLTGEVFYGLPHSTLAKAYWEHGGRYRNLLEFTEYRVFIYYYTASAPSNGLRAASSTDGSTYVGILYNLILNNIAFEVFQNEQDNMQYLSIIRALPHLLKYPDGESLLSKSFIYGFIKLLFESRSKADKKTFLFLDFFLLPNTLPNLFDVAFSYFSNILYNKDSYGEACYFLALIYNQSEKHQNDITEILDYKKLATLINYPLAFDQLSYTIKSLLKINENLAGSFLGYICENRQKDLGWVIGWIKESYILFKYSNIASNIIYTTEPRNKKLEDLIVEIEEKITNRISSFNDEELRLLLLEVLYKIDTSLALEMWRQLDKESYVCEGGIGFKSVCLAVSNLSKLDDRIKKELYEIVDCKNLALGANKSENILKISESFVCLFKTDTRLGVKFWDELDKDIIINESEESFESVFSFIKTLMKQDNRILTELLAIVDWERLAIKASHSDNCCKVAEAFEHLNDINKQLAISFWNDLDKQHLINMSDSNIRSIASFLEKMIKFDDNRKDELDKYIDVKKLAIKANQEDNVEDIASLFNHLSEINSNTSVIFWDLLDKEYYAKKFLHADILEYVKSFLNLSNGNHKIAIDFWKAYIDFPSLASKIKDQYYNSLVSALVLILINEFKEEAEILCSHFNTSILLEMFDRASKDEPLLPSQKMRTAITFIIHGVAITEDYKKILSEGVEEFTRSLIEYEYPGWIIHDDEILKQEPIAAKAVFEHICNEIGVEIFISKILKSKSEELIGKCYSLFEHFDANDSLQWKQHLQ